MKNEITLKVAKFSLFCVLTQYKHIILAKSEGLHAQEAKIATKVVKMPQNKVCNRCKAEKPLTTEFWYPQRPRVGHPKGSWQSNCKTCWQEVNRANKLRRKLVKQSNAANGLPQIQGHTSATDKLEQVV